MDYVVFDIETYSPSGSTKIDTNKDRVSVVGAYISWIDAYLAFMENHVSAFLDVLSHASLVVGYNHVSFDLPVLQKYSSFDVLLLPNYDIMLEIEKKLGFKPKLDDIAAANIGQQKTDSWKHVRHYYEQKNWVPLIDYCMHDVRLTHLIFKQIISGQPIKYPDLLETKQIILDKPRPGAAMQPTAKMQSLF